MTTARKSRKTTDKLAEVHLEHSNREADNHAHVEDELDRMERSQRQQETLPGAVSVPGFADEEAVDAEAFREDFANDDESTPNQPVVVTAHLVDQNDNPEVLRETLQQVQARNQQLEQELNRQLHDKTSQVSAVLAESPNAVPVTSIEPKAVCVDGELDGSHYDDHDEAVKKTSSRDNRWVWLVLILAIAIGAAILVPVLILSDDKDDDDEEYDLMGGGDATAPTLPSAAPTVASSSLPTIGLVGSFMPLLRINCGNDMFLPGGLTPIGLPRAEDWIIDVFFDGRGSEVVRNDYNFSSIDFGFLYQTSRQQSSESTSIIYTLPVNTTGLVAIQVHFVETDNTTAVGQHVFDVFLQEQPVLTDFDILETATELYHPVVETLFASVRKGEVRLELNATQGLAKLSGIGVYSFG